MSLSRHFLFEFGPDAAAEFGANKPVQKVATEKEGEGVLVGLRNQSQGGNDEQETGDWALGAPIQSFEAGVADFAEHHKAKKEEKGREGIFKISDDAIGFVVFEQQESDGSNESGGGGDGESAEVFGAGWVLGFDGEGIKAGEAHGSTNEVDEGDHPTNASGELGQHDFKNKEGRCDSEGDDVSERVELTAEGAFVSAEAGDAAIEHIEDEGAQNPKQAGFVGLGPSDVILRLKQTALDDLQNSHKAAEEIARGHQAGEEVGDPFARRAWGAIF